MKDCCDHKLDELADLSLRQAKILKVALGINALIFVLEFATGWFSHSTALLGDSLDMLGDAFVYAMSLYVIGKNTKWRASVSLIKGGIMSAFGLGVLLAAGAVSLTQSKVPDLIVGICISALVLKSALEVFKDSMAAIR